MTTETPKEVNKVVLGWKDGTGSIGVQAADCDPYFKVLAVPSVEELVALLPQALEEAQAQWSEATQYPAYIRPAPEPQAARPARSRGRQAAAAPPAPPAPPKPPEETSPKLF